PARIHVCDRRGSRADADRLGGPLHLVPARSARPRPAAVRADLARTARRVAPPAKWSRGRRATVRSAAHRRVADDVHAEISRRTSPDGARMISGRTSHAVEGERVTFAALLRLA